MAKEYEMAEDLQHNEVTAISEGRTDELDPDIAELNAQGARTALGKPFAPYSLDRILKNEKYIGIYKYKDITVPDGIPSIVETDLFYKVQSVLKKNKKAPARKKAETDYLLTGKMFCGKCGGNMIG